MKDIITSKPLLDSFIIKLNELFDEYNIKFVNNELYLSESMVEIQLKHFTDKYFDSYTFSEELMLDIEKMIRLNFGRDINIGYNNSKTIIWFFKNK